jgi:hypothetical protein
MNKFIYGVLLSVLTTNLLANRCDNTQLIEGEKVYYIKSFKLKTDIQDFKQITAKLTNEITQNTDLETEKKDKQYFMKFHKALKLKTRIKTTYFTFEKEDFETKNLLFKKPFDVTVTRGKDKNTYVHYLDVCADTIPNKIEEVTMGEIVQDIEKSIAILSNDENAFQNIPTYTQIYKDTDISDVTNKIKVNIKKHGYKMIKFHEDFDGVRTIRACKEANAREILKDDKNHKMAVIMPCTFTLQELENGDVQLSALDFDWVSKNDTVSKKMAKVYQVSANNLKQIYNISQ